MHKPYTILFIFSVNFLCNIKNYDNSVLRLIYIIKSRYVVISRFYYTVQDNTR